MVTKIESFKTSILVCFYYVENDDDCMSLSDNRYRIIYEFFKNFLSCSCEEQFSQ